jgi:hypothetical protein
VNDLRGQCQKNGFHYFPNCDNSIPDPEALQVQLQAVTQERDRKHAYQVDAEIELTTLRMSVDQLVADYAQLQARNQKLEDALRAVDSTLCPCRYTGVSRKPDCNCDIHAAHRIADAALTHPGQKDPE